MNKRKLLERIIHNPKNTRFADMIILLEYFGFELIRRKGSHHIFKHPKIEELLNLQNVQGEAKPYQVRQFLRLVEKYNLESEEKK